MSDSTPHRHGRPQTGSSATDQPRKHAASDEHPLSVGAAGPICHHDSHVVEKLAAFDRERVPERVVHAKGSGAFGELEITEDVSRYTKAAVFQPGAKTPLLARFSTVAGEQCSPDTWRGPRGFSLKFYTTEGNLDIVGTNTPVFFVRDGVKFPDFIHSQKRLPGSGLRENTMQWDFWTRSPESAHQVTYLMGPRGIPKSYRHMNGYGSHTYQWVNDVGERFWIKYHFITDQGVEGLTDDDAAQVAGEDADAHRRDLHEAIANGDFPSWTLYVQVMPYEDAKDYRFNPFDVTKTISKKDYPRVEVGKFTLTRNPLSHFAQIEQAAFSPGNTVPGVEISPDKMLLTRVFSYPDTHRRRIGPNFADLPVNFPYRAEQSTYSHDGPVRSSSAHPNQPLHSPHNVGSPVAGGEKAADERRWESDGDMLRAAATLHSEDDDFGQAGTLFREVYSDEEKAQTVANIAAHVGDVSDQAIQERAFRYWEHVDADLGTRVREAVARRRQ